MTGRRLFRICFVNFFLIVSAASAESVHLAWEANPEGNLAGYNVYRAGTSSGPFTRLNAEPVRTPFYSDNTAAPNSTYHYAVTAVDNVGTESALSAKVRVTTGPYDEPAFVVRAVGDWSTRSGEMVFLSGSAWVPDDRRLAFMWSQLSGPPVSISGRNRREASFIAPVVSADTLLAFGLTVTDTAGQTTTDMIAVTVHRRQ